MNVPKENPPPHESVPHWDVPHMAVEVMLGKAVCAENVVVEKSYAHLVVRVEAPDQAMIEDILLRILILDDASSLKANHGLV